MSKPKDDPRGIWTYLCTSCGEEIDDDHDYCARCDQRGGVWELTGADGEAVRAADAATNAGWSARRAAQFDAARIAADGEAVDTALYGDNALADVLKYSTLLLIRLDQVLDSEAMQVKVDQYGNEACRLVRGGIRSPKEYLSDAIRRANRKD